MEAASLGLILSRAGGFGLSAQGLFTEPWVGPSTVLGTRLGVAQSSHCNRGRERDGDSERCSNLANVTQ